MSAEQTVKFLAFIPRGTEQEIKIFDSIEDIKKINFENQEDAKNLRIFEIEFKRKIPFKTRIEIEI